MEFCPISCILVLNKELWMAQSNNKLRKLKFCYVCITSAINHCLDRQLQCDTCACACWSIGKKTKIQFFTPLYLQTFGSPTNVLVLIFTFRVKVEKNLCFYHYFDEFCLKVKTTTSDLEVSTIICICHFYLFKKQQQPL